jgi:ABC-type transport system involved in cytochrome bd biosynthesis fused ATPase/permease subunit
LGGDRDKLEKNLDDCAVQIMSDAIVPSTLVLTLLMVIGLIFFIRASAKDRTQIVKLTAACSEESLLTQLQQYFDQRAYRVKAVDATANQVIFEGVVRPSVFLTILLTLMAAVGALCLALVLSMVLPLSLRSGLSLLLLAPLAGGFYWRSAGRSEQVSLQVEANSDPLTSLITVKAHRDELAELQRALSLVPREVE